MGREIIDSMLFISACTITLALLREFFSCHPKPLAVSAYSTVNVCRCCMKNLIETTKGARAAGAATQREMLDGSVFGPALRE
jgi:hypothetical protein